MRLATHAVLSGLLGVLEFCLIASNARADLIALSPTWSANAYNASGAHVTLTGQSTSGYTYSGTGTAGLPGTTAPDSRRRPKIYQDFASFNAGGVGSTLSMTYDIKWGGGTNPSNTDTGWRFGFINSAGNGGKSVSLGANFDLGNLAGTNFHEFFVDTSLTSSLGTPASGTMDSAFTATLNDPLDPTSKIGQSTTVPPGNNVAFNDIVKTHRVTLSLTRIVNGYDLAYSWQNVAVGGTTISNALTITTSDGDAGAALAAGITSWDRLGFFVNADVISGSKPWNYTLSNLSVNAAAVPEPSAACLVGALLFAGVVVEKRLRRM